MGGGGKGGSSGGALRFPPYLEKAHDAFLTGNDGKNLVVAFGEAWDDNPYTDRPEIDFNGGYLGTGYTIDNFPSLFDMFGKFMAGLDIEILWSQIYEATTEGPEADNLIDAFSQETLDRMNEESLPVLHAGMRDIGAINSTAFAVGRTLMESKRQKEVTKFSAQVKMQLLQISHDRWAKHLEWNKNVIATYDGMMKAYYVGWMDKDQIDYKYKEAEALWRLSLFDYMRTALGALTGTPASSKDKGPSDVQKALGGAFSGAATGAMIGNAVPGIGTAMGGAVGGVLGLAGGFL